MSTAIDIAIGAAPRRRRWGRQTRFLAQSVVLEEIGPPRVLGAIVLLLGLSIAAFLAWAAVTPLSQRVTSSGQVIPSGAVMAVQHWEGGIVGEILTREGALVDAGAVLVRLDPAGAESDLQERETRIAALDLQAERLRAFAEGRTPDFGAVDPRYAALLADQQKILILQEQQRDSQRDVLRHQLSQRRSELAVLANQEKTFAEQVRILDEVVTMRRELHEKGLNSKVVYLGTLQQLVTAKGELARVRADTARVRQAIAEAGSKLAQIDAELRSTAMQQMGQVTAELAQLRQAAEKSRDRVERLHIRAPVRGIVKSLVPNTLGGVIAPGSQVAEIVPLDEALVVEARIDPRDIGQLRPGQQVTVKLSSYDFYRFGAVDGVLDRLSASTFQDKDGSVYYKATINLKRAYVGDDPSRNLILPGMTVEADVNTGERTVLEYLLKPVYVSFSEAFGER